MQQLIKIETVPISIEYVEKAQKHTSSKTARLHISQNETNMTIKSNPIRINPVDNFEAASSAGNNMYYTATANYGENGNLNMNVQMVKDSPGNAFFQKVGRGIENIIDAMPKSQVPSFAPSDMQINFNVSSINDSMAQGGVAMENLDTSFLPPDLEIKILEMPRVIIKYVGGPIYIPRSSDPDYIPPKEINQIFDGKPNLDVKA